MGVNTVLPPPPVKAGAPSTVPPKTTYRLYNSSDLLDWKQQQDIPFPEGRLPAHLIRLVDNAGSATEQWMFLHGGGRYWFGQFDGSRFTTEQKGGSLQSGNGYVAFRMMSGGDPKSLPYVCLIGTAADGGQVTGSGVAFGRRLQLQGAALIPAREPLPAGWSEKPKQWKDYDLEPSLPLTVVDAGSLFHLQIQAQAEQAESFRVIVFGLPIGFNFTEKKYGVGGRGGEFPSSVVMIEGIVDVDLAELTIGGVGPVGFQTASGPDATTPLELRSTGGKVRITSLTVTPLKPSNPPSPP
jgi:hypothetical protein